MINVTPVILCGGSGARLWLLSRTGFPRQFLCLAGNESLFQQSAQRLSMLGNNDVRVAQPLIVTGECHRFLAAEELLEAGTDPGRVLLKPVGRNTALALTFAALAAIEAGQDLVLVVTPADQTVATHDVFVEDTLSVLRKGHGHPDAFIHRQANKPAVQQFVLNMLEQLPFRAHREQYLNQTRPQQPLCRNPRTAGVRVQLGKRAVHRSKNAINQRTQFAQWMPCRNPFFQTSITEHRVLCRIRRSDLLQSKPDRAAIVSLASRVGVFEQPVNPSKQFQILKG